jgi:Type VII secretion system ESX-1, transport TM domain B
VTRVASKRDLVEAHSFVRRRLTRAFVTGESGGPGLDPPGFVRALICGVGVAALLLGGASALTHL